MTTIEKAKDCLEKYIQYTKENECHPARAWDAIKKINNLTEEEMQQVMLVAFFGHMSI